MTAFTGPALIPAFPEIFLACLSLFLLMLGVATQKEEYRTVSRFAILTLFATGIMVLHFGGEKFTTFGDMFIIDAFAVFMKLLVITGSMASIVMASRYVERARIMRYEYPVLILFATLGMMLMISANDLMALYMGLELQSLSLYVLAAMQRDTVRSAEAGVKYFILGALSSGMLLYGASLLYGYTGTTGFEQMAVALISEGGMTSPGVTFGVALVACALAFKISAVPFHMWTPDVYEGAPTSVTAFFAIAPKMAALALLVRVFTGPFWPLVEDWQQIVILMSILSMALGGVAAIAQSNIKRMLAYSSIGHMGYALAGLTAAGKGGVKAVLVYAVIYMVTSIGAFAIVLMMKRKDQMVEKISDLSGLARTQPVLALAMAVMMFSMAGIPPLAGFFGKLFVFQAVVAAELYTLAVVGVVTSVIAAYYYLRVIKVMYFDEDGDEALDPAEDGGLKLMLAASFVAVVFFVVMPGPLLTSAAAAAKSLMPTQ